MTSSVSRLDLIWNRSRAPDHPVGRACLLSAFYAFLLANLYLPPPFPSKNSIPIFPISRRESVSLKGRLREGLKDFFFFFFFSRYGRKLWNFIGEERGEEKGNVLSLLVRLPPREPRINSSPGEENNGRRATLRRAKYVLG